MRPRTKTAIKWGFGMLLVQVALMAARIHEGKPLYLIEEAGILFAITFWFAVGYGLGYFVGPKKKEKV